MSARSPLLLLFLVLLVPRRLPGFFTLAFILLAQRFGFELVPVTFKILESVGTRHQYEDERHHFESRKDLLKNLLRRWLLRHKVRMFQDVASRRPLCWIVQEHCL